MPFEQISNLALKVRGLNKKRYQIKAEIVDTFSEGFKEIKINNKKINFDGVKIN